MSGFLCAFEIPIPGSPISASSPIQTGKRELELFLMILALNNSLRVVILFRFLFRLKILEKKKNYSKRMLAPVGNRTEHLKFFILLMRNLKFREPKLDR